MRGNTWYLNTDPTKPLRALSNEFQHEREFKAAAADVDEESEEDDEEEKK